MRPGLSVLVIFALALEASQAFAEETDASADLCSPLLQAAKAQTGKILPAEGTATLRNALFGPRLLVPPSSPPDPGLARRAMRLFPHAAEGAALQLQLLAPGVWRAAFEDGPASCSHDRFFRQLAGGRLQSIPPPAAYGDLCWSSGRSVGEEEGAPVLVELDQGPGGASLALEVTPWRSQFSRACRLQIRLRPRFKVRERHCADAALCAAGEPVARALAEAFTAGLERSPAAAEASPQISLPARAAAAGDGIHGLPSLGSPLGTEFTEFSAVETRRPAKIGRQSVVVRVGLASVAGRPLGDPLVVIYRQIKTGLEPLASYVLQPVSAEVAGAEATPPEPFIVGLEP